MMAKAIQSVRGERIVGPEHFSSGFPNTFPAKV
jgi:hypothetical protein